MASWPVLSETLLNRMGIEITEASADRVVGTMPVEGNVQPFGLLHGGASCVLAESLGSIGASLHAHPGYAVGVDINATHHRALKDGVVTGVATAGAPRPQRGLLRGRDHRRAGPAGVHGTHHVQRHRSQGQNSVRPNTKG